VIKSTSIAAKVSIRPIAKTLRGQVFRFILNKGAFGATLDEIQTGLDMGGNTARPRRKELEKKGLVIDSGARRLTASNRQAIVWVIPDRVAAAARKKGML